MNRNPRLDPPQDHESMTNLMSFYYNSEHKKDHDEGRSAKKERLTTKTTKAQK